MSVLVIKPIRRNRTFPPSEHPQMNLFDELGVSEREWKAVWDDETDISSEELQKHGMTAEAPIFSYRYAARIAPHGSQ